MLYKPPLPLLTTQCFACVFDANETKPFLETFIVSIIFLCAALRAAMRVAGRFFNVKK